MFIKLTDAGNKKESVYIEISFIKLIINEKSGTCISNNNIQDRFYVQETPEEIMQLIKEQSK